MRLYTQNGEFTLPEDFALEMQTNNPVFTSEGSASATFSLPATPENLEAAGSPDRLSRETAFLNNVECIMQLGAFQLQGRLIVTSCNSEEIGCCFTYKEGSLYASYKNESLKDILRYEKYHTSTLDIRVLATYTQRGMEDGEFIPTNIVSFPVKVQLMEGYDIILNELEDTSDEYGASFGDIIYQARSYTKGDTTINVPDGYGLTAFPFMYHIVEVILKAVGNYNIVRNDFTKEPFRHLVLLHPVADLMCKGNIAYRDLVPDITLSDFMSWLQDKFGAYIFTYDKDVSIVILERCCPSLRHLTLLHTSTMISHLRYRIVSMSASRWTPLLLPLLRHPSLSSPTNTARFRRCPTCPLTRPVFTSIPLRGGYIR